MDAVRERGLVVICHGASDLYNAPPEFARICAAYPEVPFMMAHSGTFWSHDQAMEVAADTPNLYLETARVPVFEVSLSVRQWGRRR
nr:amidohydrolase family protein [Angustibacter aerolatus]